VIKKQNVRLESAGDTADIHFIKIKQSSLSFDYLFNRTFKNGFIKYQITRFFEDL
jgi:hypothetical protein